MKKLELIQKKQEQKREANQQVKMNAPATSKTENRCNENYNNNPNENHVISDTISDAADEIRKGKNDMTVMERIQEHLNNEGVEYDIREDNEAVRFNVGGEMLEDPLLCTIFTDEDSFVTVVDMPFECEMGCLDEMAKFLTQLNCGMWMGNFDLDFDDGELSFRCFMQAMDGMPSDQVIGTAIVSAVRAIEMNAEDIHQVAIGASTAHDIIYAGEAKLEQ